jgi:hypothetical protein
MLGDMLAGLDDDAQATELILGLDDLELLPAIRGQAEAEGIDLVSYAREAVQRYAAQASDEEWLTLMGLIGRADDPARACLRRAFAFALRRQGEARETDDAMRRDTHKSGRSNYDGSPAHRFRDDFGLMNFQN